MNEYKEAKRSRAKFTVKEVTELHSYNWGGINPSRRRVKVKLSAVQPDKSYENTAFAKSTPGGEISFEICNEDLVDTFEPGQDYYVDLSPVPPEKPEIKEVPE